MQIAIITVLMFISAGYAVTAASDRELRRKIIDTAAFVATLAALVLIGIFY